MDEMQKERNKIKTEAKKLRKYPVDNIQKEIEENYEIGIQYYKEIEKNDN